MNSTSGSVHLYSLMYSQPSLRRGCVDCSENEGQIHTTLHTNVKQSTKPRIHCLYCAKMPRPWKNDGNIVTRSILLILKISRQRSPPKINKPKSNRSRKALFKNLGQQFWKDRQTGLSIDLLCNLKIRAPPILNFFDRRKIE